MVTQNNNSSAPQTDTKQDFQTLSSEDMAKFQKAKEMGLI